MEKGTNEVFNGQYMFFVEQIIMRKIFQGLYYTN